MKFNIQEFGKVKKFLVVYYKWGHYEKVPFAKMTMEKYVRKLFDGYKEFTERYDKVHKTLALLEQHSKKIPCIL